MAATLESVEISRRPEDVFRYVTDPSHLSEWQVSVVSVLRDGDTPVTVGSMMRTIASAQAGDSDGRRS
jgi:uncharacterized protein YndB with AHSA1/START domain